MYYLSFTDVEIGVQLRTEPHTFARCHLPDARETSVSFTGAEQQQRTRREAAAIG